MDSGYGSPRRGGRVEITVYREPLTFVLNERRGRKKESGEIPYAHPNVLTHIRAKCGFTGRTGL